MFFGIKISMYWEDHQPPHFHAHYQEYDGIYTLDGSKIAGNIPSKQEKLIIAWTIIHEQELLENWEKAQNGNTLKKINPLTK